MMAEQVVHFIRNYTAEPLGNALQEAASKAGLAVKATFGAYENMAVELAGLGSTQEVPSIVILTIDLDYFAGGLFSPQWKHEQAVEELKTILSAVAALPANTFSLLSTFIPPFRTQLPSVPGHPVLGRSAAAFELNALLREFVAQRGNRCGILDFERIAARLGEAATLDKRFGLMMKAPFKQGFVEAAAEEIIRFLHCRLLPPKKVLILDCDNTLWGGVVGEVGMEGIHLDPYEGRVLSRSIRNPRHRRKGIPGLSLQQK
jgi:predicted enzyme involved in methoxymalonyl-ACP biosynthesis